MGLHMPELIIVLVVALLIFGPKKLPEMGSAIGKGINALRKGMHEVSTPEDPDTPEPTPQDALPGPTHEPGSHARATSPAEETRTEKQA